MKPKTMILMVVAVVCGLGASYMTSRLLAEREDNQPAAQAAPPPVEKVTLLVTKRPLPIGQLLKNAKTLFAERQFTKEDAPKDAVSDWKTLEGKTLKRSLRSSDHVFADDVREGPATLEVPPGMRALGLPVNLAAIASGFASLPGSRVDIIWNMRGNNPDQTFSMELLQNVLVLAADMQDTTSETRALPASVVTVAVSPEDVKRVSLAMENGTFRLVLRQPNDTVINTKSEMVKLSDLWSKRERTERIEEVLPPTGEEKDLDAPRVTEEKWEPIPAPQIRRHVVTRREGERQWKEVYELDEDDREDAPVNEPQRPVSQAPQQPEAQQAPAVEAGRAKGG